MYGSGNQPVIVLKEGTERSKDKEAQFNNISAAKAVADAVRSTLGPKGMDKMIQQEKGEVLITNDGATILSQMQACLSRPPPLMHPRSCIPPPVCSLICQRRRILRLVMERQASSSSLAPCSAPAPSSLTRASTPL